MSEKVLEPIFWQKCIRFLEPISVMKVYAGKQIFKGIINWSNPFVHVLFIQKIISFIELNNESLFFSWMLYYLFYVIFYELVNTIAYNWGWFSMDPEVRKVLGNKYVSKYINLDNTVSEKIGTGKAISVIDKGIDTWASGLTRFLWNGAGLLASFIIALSYLSQLHYSASIIFIIFFISAILFSLKMNEKMIVIRKKRNEQVHLHTRHIVKLIMSKFEVMQSYQAERETGKLSGYMDKSKMYNLQMAKYFHSFYDVPYFFLSILKIAFLFYISQFIFSGEISIAQFVGVFAIMLILEEMLMRFIDFFKQLSKEFSMIVYLWTFFDTTPQITGYEEGNTFEHKSGKIELKNLSYGYDASKPIFQKFDLEIPGNKITALVGPSGGGKSTLVKLISGYIRQDSGEIIIDDQKLSETSLKSYYADVGYLTQEPSVFDGTVRENLLYAVTPPLPTSPTLGEEQIAASSSLNQGGIEVGGNIEEIISLAHCDFIYDLPNGLDTEIGERGVKLSGGQKQRLAIAKIFLKDPKIIILDEPTSALDSLSEQKITEAMHNLFQDRTVLVIAHRLQTVKHADDIIVIEGGEIKERGTHDVLVEKNGFYKQMLDLQSGF